MRITNPKSGCSSNSHKGALKKVEMKKASKSVPVKGGGSDACKEKSQAFNFRVSSKPKPPPNTEEFMRVITATRNGTIIRNLRVPRGPPPSEILPTREDLIIAEESRKLHVEELKLACEQRNAEAERKAKEIHQATLDRAHYLQMEEEYDIRNLNSIIIGAKFNALNEAKVEENKLLREKILEEEKALDALDDLTNRKYWDALDEREKRQREFRVERRKGINAQIEHNLEVKRQIAEFNRKEGQMIREASERKAEQMLLDKKRKRVDDRRMHAENMRVNEIIMNKEKRKREEKFAEMKHMEQVQKKLEIDDGKAEKRRQIRADSDRLHHECVEALVRQRKLLAEAQKGKEESEKRCRMYYHLKKASDIAEHRLKKLDYLRTTGLPDIYFSGVERKAGFLKDDQKDTNMANMWNSRMPDVPKIKISHKYWSYI